MLGIGWQPRCVAQAQHTLLALLSRAPWALVQCPCCGMSTVAVINACWNRCAPVLEAVEAAGGGGGVLEHLILSHSHLGAGGLAPAPLTPAQQLSLSRCRRLQLTRCHGGPDLDASLHEGLRTMLEQLPALEDLDLRSVHLDSAALPALLGTATALAGLTLVDCGLTDLPAGAYLAGAWAAGGTACTCLGLACLRVCRLEPAADPAATLLRACCTPQQAWMTCR